jgi:hypothetical protein
LEKQYQTLHWDEAPDMLHIRECASLFHIGINQMYRIARTKGFPALYFGKQIRVPKDALKNWVDNQILN